LGSLQVAALGFFSAGSGAAFGMLGLLKRAWCEVVATVNGEGTDASEVAASALGDPGIVMRAHQLSGISSEYHGGLSIIIGISRRNDQTNRIVDA
jgi:hypothetical protein